MRNVEKELITEFGREKKLRIITFNVQMHRITFSITFTIAPDACKKAAFAATYILQH